MSAADGDAPAAAAAAAAVCNGCHPQDDLLC